MVQEKIINKLVEDKHNNMRIIGQLSILLKVPRLHYKYIEQNGIHPYI